MASPRVKAYAALILGVFSTAFSGIFVTWANAPGTVTGFYRMVITVIVLAFPFWLRSRHIGHFPRKALWLALLAGIFFAIDLALWNTGILISGAANPTLMGNTAPVWVGLGAMLFFKEKLNRLFWLGLLVALVGAAIILGQDALNNVGLGTFLGLLAGIFYGAYFLVIQRIRRQLDALTTFWPMAVSATAASFVASLLLGQPILGYSPTTYLNFLALGLIVQVVGQFAVSYALGDLPASIVAPTMLGQPVLTAVLAVPLLNQPITLWQAIGGVIVLGGIYTVHYSRSHRSQRDRTIR